MELRLGLFGGSFDPVHRGHLLVARAALEVLELTRLYFIPALQSPFKPESQPAPPELRLRLLRLALAGETQYEIDPQEIQRGGISYTIDTVESYSHRFPGARLFYLIGADHVQQLPHWRSASTLARLAEFLVVSRPGELVAQAPRPFQLRVLSGFPLGVSSSQVRDRIRVGLPIHELVPSSVAEAIQRDGLYR